MGARAFFIAGGKATIIANDIADTRYHAGVHEVFVGMPVPTRTDPEFETQIVLESGTLEFMIDGATAVLAAPNLVRVPPGIAHAYRNIGHDTARILLRTVRPVPQRRTIRAHVEFAA